MKVQIKLPPKKDVEPPQKRAVSDAATRMKKYRKKRLQDPELYQVCRSVIVLNVLIFHNCIVFLQLFLESFVENVMNSFNFSCTAKHKLKEVASIEQEALKANAKDSEKQPGSE